MNSQRKAAGPDAGPRLLEMHNATVWHGSTRVFHELCLTIGGHERVAVIGPNGAGKTTLLKTISRELYPVVRKNAWVRVFGHERWNVWELRHRLGIVSPDLQANFLPDATVEDAVQSGYFSSIGLYRQQRDQLTCEQVDHAESVLRTLGLGPLRDRTYRTLSTGEQRRCLLGRALVHDPDTLILDEPTSGLDMAAAFGFVKTIRDLARHGRSLVLVTHHLNDIPPEIDRVIVLKEGAVVADGPKAAVLDRSLLSDVFGVDIRVTKVDGWFLAHL